MKKTIMIPITLLISMIMIFTILSTQYASEPLFSPKNQQTEQLSQHLLPENENTQTINLNDDNQHQPNYNTGSSHLGMKPDYKTRMEWIERYHNAKIASYHSDSEFSASSLPSGVNLLSYLEYTPAEHNQGNCGNCWAWAGTGCLQIALHTQVGISKRLSVQYINSCQEGVLGKTCCDGGWLYHFSDFYSITGQCIPWSNTNAYWQDGDESCNTLCSDITKNPYYSISSIEEETVETHDVGQTTAINNIKQALANQQKAVWFAFFAPTSADWSQFTDFWANDQTEEIWNPDSYNGHTWDDGSGHAVLCVGYQDNPGTNNDYWIMLNSWGITNERSDGIFYLDMHMNYDCYYFDPSPYGYYTFWWQTLNVSFDTDGNQPPTAIIDSISPNPADIDESVAFNGHGIDVDGTIVDYEWSSDIDGLLNTSASFSTSTLSAGEHTISFKVKDNNETWSQSAERTLMITTEQNQPPTADAGGPYKGTIGNPITFDGSNSNDPDGSIISWTWDYGDDDQKTGMITDYTYKKSGTYTVTLTVTDDQGSTATDSTTAFINQPPIAHANGPYYVVYGESFVLNASKSKDEDGSITGYRWDIESDGKWDTGWQKNPLYTISSYHYPTCETYMITLQVKDNNGDIATDYAMIYLSIPPETPSHPRPTSYVTGIHLTPTLEWTPCDDQDQGDTVTYNVYFGTNWPKEPLPLVSSNQEETTFQPFKIFQEQKLKSGITYYWQIVAEDSHHVTSKSPVWRFTTRAYEPTITIESFTVNNQQLQFTVKNHAYDYAENLPWIITLEPKKDAEIITPTSHILTGSIYRIPPMHTATVSVGTIIGYGFIDANLSVQSNHRNADCFLTLDSVSIVSENTPPIADLGGPYHPKEHNPVYFDGSHSYDPDGEIVSYHWDFGDDTTASMMNPTHTYTSDGFFTVTLTVTDDDGDSDTVTETIIVQTYKTWTVMIYLDGDINLESHAIDDFLEMAEIGSNDHINILAQFDRRPGYDNRYGDWTTTKRFYIEQGMNPTSENAISDLGEQNMGDAATLYSFVNWSISNFPSDYTMLIMWDHGGAWTGVCQDDTNQNDILTLGELKTALQESLSGKKLNILGFADCLMANLETYYQIKDTTDYIIGSEHSSWAIEPYGQLWDFADILSYTMNQTDIQNITEYIVDSIFQQINTIDSTHQVSHTWSVVETSALPAVATNLSLFADELLNALPAHYSTIQNQRYKTEAYGSDEFYDTIIDLSHFTNLIQQQSTLPASLQQQSTSLNNALDQAIIYNKASIKGAEDYPVDHAHGLSIYYPETIYSYDEDHYELLDFCADTNWNEFLEQILLS